MKWEKKGKQFDTIGEKFKNVRTIFIYGAGMLGVQLYEKLVVSDVDIVFVDADINKQKNGVYNAKVMAPPSLLNIDKGDSIVVVAIPRDAQAIIEKKLSMYGFCLGQNMFDVQMFEELYLPIFLLYHDNINYLKIVDLSLTQKCNLKCKDCSILTPYIKEPKHRELESVLKDIDILFDRVDFVDSLYLIGGEPLMYPEITQVCEYVGRKYRDKMITFSIATNGLVSLKRDLIEVSQKYQVSFQISDYSNSLNGIKTKLEEFVKQLDENDIKYLRMVDFNWCDYGFLSPNSDERDANTLIDFFDDCAVDCRGIEDGRLYYCFPAMMNQKYFGSEYVDLGFDLNNINNNYKKELLEFSLGYSEKGYLEMCKKCNGCYRVNKKFIPVAEQM